MCPNIETIIISNDLFDAKSWSQVIRLVITYCRHLVSINCRFDELSKSLFKQFVEKFGNKLKCFEISYLQWYVLGEYSFYISSEMKSLVGSDLKQLKDLRIKASVKEKYLLKDLFKKYKTLRYLKIHLYDFEEENHFK